MNKPKCKQPAVARKGEKSPRDPRRSREPIVVEELDNYTPSYQVDPWRGQFMQLCWDYCV